MTPREHKARRLIARASTTRLCKIDAKGGPLSEWAAEQLSMRTDQARMMEDTPCLEHPFMDFAISEAIAVSLNNPWDKFLAEVSKLTGIENLDGDDSKGNPNPDGYSLDQLFNWFRVDISAAEAAHRINARRTALGRQPC